jgi:hypothetical protein
MASVVQLKRSSVSGRIPDAANVEVGEPVINLADQIIFTKDGSGTVKVIGAGTTSNISEGSNLYFTNARAIGALTPGTGITLDSNGLISADATGGSGDTFKTINVNNGLEANIVASGQDVLKIETSGLISANTNSASKTLKLSLGGLFPFFDSAGSQNSIALRVLDSEVQESVNYIYLPFTKSDGTAVTTLRYQ